MVLLKEEVVLLMSVLHIDAQAGNQLGNQETEVNIVTDMSWPLIGAPVLLTELQRNVIQIATVVHDAKTLEMAAIMRSVGQGHGEILGQGRRAGTSEKKPGQVHVVQGIIVEVERKWMNDSDAGRSMTSLPFPVDVQQTDRRRRERDRKWKVGTGERSERKNLVMWQHRLCLTILVEQDTALNGR